MAVSDAIEGAKNHLVTVLPDYAKADHQLEELETSASGSRWSFTFSATLPASTGDYVANLAEVLRWRRISKAVRIEAESGLLLSGKNATVQRPKSLSSIDTVATEFCSIPISFCSSLSARSSVGGLSDSSGPAISPKAKSTC